MPCYSLDGIVPVIDPSAFVHPTAVLIGDVIVGPNCYVGPCACLRGDFGRIVLEAGANVQDTCVVHGFPKQDTVVAENGHIGHGAVLHSCIVRRDALVGMALAQRSLASMREVEPLRRADAGRARSSVSEVKSLIATKRQGNSGSDA